MKHKWLRGAGLIILTFICGFVIYHLVVSGISASILTAFATLLWWFFRGDRSEFMEIASSCGRFLLVVLLGALVLFSIFPALIRTFREPGDGTAGDEQP